MIFTVAIISPGFSSAKGASVASVIELMDAVDGVDRPWIEHHETGTGGVEIAPPGKGCAHPCSIPRECFCDTRRRRIFRHIIAFEAGHRNFSDTGIQKVLNVGLAEHSPFLEKAPAGPQAMYQDAAFGFGRGYV